MTLDGERKTRRARARAIVKARLEKLEDLSIGKLVPSTLTLLGLVSGITAIRFAVDGQWAYAVDFVILAMVFDMLDGRAARVLGADSRFGAQLDSLAQKKRQAKRPSRAEQAENAMLVAASGIPAL